MRVHAESEYRVIHKMMIGDYPLAGDPKPTWEIMTEKLAKRSDSVLTYRTDDGKPFAKLYVVISDVNELSIYISIYCQVPIEVWRHKLIEDMEYLFQANDDFEYTVRNVYLIDENQMMDTADPPMPLVCHMYVKTKNWDTSAYLYLHGMYKYGNLEHSSYVVPAVIKNRFAARKDKFKNEIGLVLDFCYDMIENYYCFIECLKKMEALSLKVFDNKEGEDNNAD